MVVLWLLALLSLTAALFTNVVIAIDKREVNIKDLVNVSKAEVETVYNDVLSDGSKIYVYEIPNLSECPSSTSPLTTKGACPPKALRLRTEVQSHHGPEHPLHVTVTSDAGAFNWQIPFEENDLLYEKVERTLSMHGKHTRSEQQRLSLILSTSSQESVNFTVQLFEVLDFSADPEVQTNVTDVAAHSASYRYVDLGGKEGNILNVRVDSDEEVCAIVSLQRPGPLAVLDTEGVIRNNGSTFQSMLRLASFNVDRADYGDGVFIVFLVTTDDSLCGSDAKPTLNRTKTFTFRITKEISEQILEWQYLLRFGLTLFVATVVLAFHLYFHSFNKLGVDELIEAEVKRIKAREQVCQTAGDIALQIVNGAGESQGEGQEDATDGADDDDDARGIRPPKPKGKFPSHVTELDRVRQQRFLSTMTSDLHIWLVIIVGLFFAIPAIQIAYSQNHMLVTTGNQDICYFNFLCSTPMKSTRTGVKISDFNHVFSNIHYMAFGLLFIFLVWHRKRAYNLFLEKLRKNGIKTKYGLPQHHEMYYGMGIALVFEGALSAIYHICPTNRNFQFDTVFMYILAILMISKIYQFRHPDIVVWAYKVYVCVGCIIVVEVTGIYSEIGLGMNKIVFWTLALVAYLLACIILAYILYHSGKFSLDRKVFKAMCKSLYNLTVHKKYSFSRRHVILFLIVITFNMMLIVIGAMQRGAIGIASYILFVFIGNLLVYMAYYSIMKVSYRERIMPTTILWAILIMLTALPALYLFSSKQYASTLTPAESRNLNDECLLPLLSYDNHDVWHVLGAVALFFIFLMIMSLDDGLFVVPRNKIKIF